MVCAKERARVVVYIQLQEWRGGGVSPSGLYKTCKELRILVICLLRNHKRCRATWQTVFYNVFTKSSTISIQFFTQYDSQKAVNFITCTRKIKIFIPNMYLFSSIIIYDCSYVHLICFTKCSRISILQQPFNPFFTIILKAVNFITCIRSERSKFSQTHICFLELLWLQLCASV